MPMLYSGKHFGYLEADEVKEISYGDQGTTRIGIKRKADNDSEKGRRNWETMREICVQIAERKAREAAAEAERENLFGR